MLTGWTTRVPWEFLFSASLDSRIRNVTKAPAGMTSRLPSSTGSATFAVKVSPALFLRVLISTDEFATNSVPTLARGGADAGGGGWGAGWVAGGGFGRGCAAGGGAGAGAGA